MPNGTSAARWLAAIATKPAATYPMGEDDQMRLRRKASPEPDVEWTMSVHDLEPSETPVDSSSALPPPPPAPTPVRRTPRIDLQRALLTMCAVVAALALVATAFMQRDLRDSNRRQTCFLESQYRAFADSGSFDNPDDLRDALADCGVTFPEPDDE
jgi:hypothetical protein